MAYRGCKPEGEPLLKSQNFGSSSHTIIPKESFRIDDEGILFKKNASKPLVRESLSKKKTSESTSSLLFMNRLEHEIARATSVPK